MPDRDAQVGLAGAGRAEQDDVLAAGEEVELAEMQHRLAPQAGLEGEVELLERLAGREARGLDAGLAAVAVAAVGLGLEQRGGEALEAPLLGAGPIGELGQRPRGRGRLELAEQVGELGVVARVMRSARRSGPAAGPAPRRCRGDRRGRPSARGRARAR